MMWLDSLRGVAVLSVVFGHFFGSLLSPVIPAIFDPGVFGVTVFFCVSGFIIPQSVRPGDDRLRRFAIARIFRLYPAYWISVIVAVAVYGAYFRTILGDLTMMQRFVGGRDINGVYWTLQVEITFYIFVALTLFSNVFNRPRIIIAAAVFNAVIAIGFGLVRHYLHYKSSMYLPLGLSVIFLGNAFSLTKCGEIERRTFFVLAGAIWVLLSVSFWFGYQDDWEDGESLSLLITNTAALAFFYYFATRQRLNIRILMWVGAISYPLYLLHVPIRALATTYAPANRELQFLFLALASAIIISAAMHYFIERPFQRLGRQFANTDWRDTPTRFKPLKATIGKKLTRCGGE